MGKSWRVAYHRDSHHPKTDDTMLRLTVTGTGDNLTGTLKRFETTGMGTMSKSKKRAEGGAIPLTGLILKGGTPGQRKREEFILHGYYKSGGKAFEVIIQGYHSVGKNKDNTPAGRDDDQVCVRIRQKPLSTLAAAVAFAPSEPCDEQPPDEDVMTEEADPGSAEEPYDGG